MKKLIAIACLVLTLTSCKRETLDVFVVDPIQVNQSKDRDNLKSDLQFISIAYADLFGSQISNRDLQALMSGYNSVGDKQLVIDRIIRKLLTSPGINKPNAVTMRSDLDAFIQESFKRFFVRDAAEMEVWYFKSVIEENPDIQPEEIYYVLMSSEEYRYY